jgi:ATP-dependent Lhr-like helicase
MPAWVSWTSAQWASRNGQNLGTTARQVLEHLETRGASFFQELVSGTGLLRTEVESGLRELIAAGRVTGDGFAGLRALAIAPDKTLGTSSQKHKDGRPGILPVLPPTAGRWSALARNRSNGSSNGSFDAPSNASGNAPDNGSSSGSGDDTGASDPAELYARQLLWRYGVVFRRLLERENGLPPWREVLHWFRRLEARGEIRGGRFVAGFSGEQYALPEAVQQLRAARRKGPAGHFVTLSAADPLNLAGIVSPGRKIAAIAANRILCRDGLPIAAREGGEIVELHPSAAEFRPQIRTRLVRS